MKILFFIECLLAGGRERRLVELIKGLSKYSDIEMELVLTNKEIHYEEVYSTGIKIHYIIRKRFKKDLTLFYKFYKITKKFNPDIIHVWGHMVSVYAVPTKLFLCIPMINSSITNAPKSVSKTILSHKLAFLFSDLIIANSCAGLKAYSAPAQKSTVIYNGFDFKRLNNLLEKDIVKTKYQIKTKFIVGMVASFSISKDYVTFINAANLILRNRKDVTFICIGNGDDSKYKLMVESKNQRKVLFLGGQNNVESIMNICDIGVLTSFNEGLPNTIMEFMALGKGVIGTVGGGINELVTKEKTGILIPQQNYEILAKKLDLLLNNTSLKLKYGQAAKTEIENRFSIEEMVKKYYSSYLNLIERKLK